jgi:hypothetical protein
VLEIMPFAHATLTLEWTVDEADFSNLGIIELHRVLELLRLPTRQFPATLEHCRGL